MARPRTVTRSMRYFKVLRFRQLRAFCEVARQLSFTKAAETLGLAAPSLWQQVRALEQELGTELIVSEGQTLLLTDDGRLLREIASPIVESFDSVQDLFADRREQTLRRLRVATTGSLLANELPLIVQAYREQHPDVQLSFVERPSREALALLDTGDADIAIAGLLAESAVSPMIETHPCGNYPFVLICPADHALARRRRVTLNDILDQPLVMPGPSTNSRAILDRVLREAGSDRSLNIVIESFNVSTIVRYVEVGLGVALVSISPALRKQLQAPHRKPELCVRDLSALFGSESLVIAQRRGRLLLPHADAFRRMVLRGVSGSR